VSGPVIPDRRTAQLAGVVLLVAGAYCLYDAYEGRGRPRPFLMRFLLPA
jgi:hypothetical protein